MKTTATPVGDGQLFDDFEDGSLFDQLLGVAKGAVAKRNDPDTSHEAARSITKEKLTELKVRVLNIVCENGPISQERAHELYVQHHGPAAYSSARTRVNELQRLGYVTVVDRDGKTKGGRACNRYIGSLTPVLEWISFPEISEPTTGGSSVIEKLEAPPHLSPSSMGTYNQCPMKFRFSKIDKLPDEPSEATLLGNLVHDVCEQFYMYDSSERTKELITPLFAEVWESGDWINRIHPYVRGDKRIRQFKWRAVWCVENLWVVEEPTAIEPEGLEYELNGELGGVTLKGFIDRYSLTGDKLVISDYKTGKTPNPNYSDDKFLQLKIYGALARVLGVGETEKLELLYLKDGVRLEHNFTQSDFDETVEYVVSTKKAIDVSCETHEFETRKTALCNWCAYKPQCPAWS